METQQALYALLATGDAADRCHASRTLGRLGDRTAVAALTPRLRDEDIDVCIDAADALGRLGDASAIQSLLATVRQDPDGVVKITAVEALGRIGGDEAIALLLEIAAHRPDDLGFTPDVWDPWWDMQLKAVEALGRLRVAEAVPVITALLDDEDGQDIESELLNALARIGDSGEQALISRLSQSTPRGRRRAARALHLCATPTAVSALGRALMDPEPEVRAAAAQALADAGAVRYLPAILLLFRDRDGEVRRSAVQAADAMSRNSDAAAIPVPELVKLTGDADAAVRILALTTLSRAVAQLDEQARNGIATLARTDADAQVAAAACTLIGQLQDPQLAATLAEIAADAARPVELRSAAARALGRSGHWDETVATTLTQACVDAQAPLRLAALHALIELEPVSLAQDPDTRTSSAASTQPILFVLRGEVGGEDTAHATDGTANDATNRSMGSDSIDPVSVAGADAGGRSIESDPIDPDPIDLTTDAAPPVISTLEAITRMNVEVALALHDNSTATTDLPDSAPDDAALRPFLDIVRRNDTVGRWLGNRDSSADLTTDARRLAARVLGRSGNAAAVPALLAALTDADAVIRCDAARSLAEIARHHPAMPELDQAAAGLIPALASTDREERVACIQALGVLGNTGALPMLLVLLADEDTAVRSQTVQALTSLACGSATGSLPLTAAELDTLATHLLERLQDSEAPVRTAAADGLADLARPLRAAGNNARVQQLIERIAHAGLAGDGGQARPLGRALRRIDTAPVAEVLLPLLGTLANSRQRRALMEMLEEIFV